MEKVLIVWGPSVVVAYIHLDRSCQVANWEEKGGGRDNTLRPQNLYFFFGDVETVMYMILDRKSLS